MDTSEATIYHAVIMASLLLGGLFSVLVVVILRSQRKFVRLQRQRLLDEIQMLEEERTRIARDLHDELGPNLTISDVLLAEAVREEVVKLPLIRKAQQHIAETSLRMGEIARNLTPASITNKGLDAALQEFLGTIELSGKIGIDYSYRVSGPISPATSLQVYRIVQELVHNGLKHSDGSKMDVQVKERKSRLYIFYRDDGIGFNNGSPEKKRKGFGRSNVKRRVEMLGGKLQVLSEKGTTCFIELPINFTHGERTDQDSHR